MKHNYTPNLPEWHSCFHPNLALCSVCCLYQHLLKLMQSTLSSWTLAVPQTSGPLWSSEEWNQSKSDRSIYSGNGAIVCSCQWDHTVRPSALRPTWKMPFTDTQMCCHDTACADRIMQGAESRAQTLRDVSYKRHKRMSDCARPHDCSMWGGIKSGVITLLFPVPATEHAQEWWECHNSSVPKQVNCFTFLYGSNP